MTHCGPFRSVPLSFLAGLLACASADTGPEGRTRTAGPSAGGQIALQLLTVRDRDVEADSLVQVLHVQGAAGALAVTLTYDPDLLSLGTVHGADRVMLFSGEPRPGVLRVTMLTGQEGLGAAPLRLAFRRRQAGAAPPRLLAAEAASLDGAPLAAALLQTSSARASNDRAGEGFPVSPSDTPAPAPIGGAAILAPGVARYGDINGDGRVSVADVVVLGQATVGVRTIVGDAFVAANVAPSAAVGRSTGAEADGQSRLSVADLTLVNQATIGTLIGAVGQVIPPAAIGPRLIMTPRTSPASGRSAACSERLASAANPFANPATGEPWPECIGSDGLPMLVQFCVYEKTADLRWHPSLTTASAPRCLAELPQVQRGGL